MLWLLDYSCRDDYGLRIDYVSAWAGIHYFAGRKNNWAKKYKDQVFTWPEGNARLAKHFSQYVKDKHWTNHLVFDVSIKDDKVEVLTFDNSLKKTKKIIADKVLMATPQFVNERILKDKSAKSFNYVPWLLTTIILKNEVDYKLKFSDKVVNGKFAMKNGVISDELFGQRLLFNR